MNEIEINHNGHFACGLVGIPVFTEWAVKNRKSDLMYSMLKKKDYPGYLYMIEMEPQQHGNTGMAPGAGYITAITVSVHGFTRLWEGFSLMKISRDTGTL